MEWYTLLSQILSGGISFWDALIYILSTLAVIFLTLPVHEFAHGFVASKLGDTTPRYQGRLTLNPFAHIDYLGALCILLFGFGWAKPVLVNARNFKNPKLGMALTALAGPVSNLIVALVSLLFTNLISLIFFKTAFQLLFYIATFFYYIASINVSLAVFNLIPVPPLDGSRILSAFLPDRIYYKLMRYERYIVIALFALIYLGFFDLPLSVASEAIFDLIYSIASLPFSFVG